MGTLVLQIEIIKSTRKDIENKIFLYDDASSLNKDKALIFFKEWVDTIIELMVPTNPPNITYPYQNRFEEITDIDYNNKEELYNFFTSFLDAGSLAYLKPFISSLIDTIYNWSELIENIIESFHEEKICPSYEKTKFNICYKDLKLQSSLLFFVRD